jgi:lipopolysaccharide transport system ATP-binding protein
MSAGLAETGEHYWQPDEIPASAAPFRPVALRVKDTNGRMVDSFRSTEPVRVEFEYCLDAPITGLRTGIYLLTNMGEFIFVSYDTDDEKRFNQFGARPAGRYRSVVTIPANLLNEGGYVLGVNASSYRIKRYFEAERALMFSIDGTGAPGKQWPEKRLGPVRPALDWQIETL